MEIRFLCEKFLAPMNAVKNEFRDYKDSRGKTEMGQVLRHLVNRVNSLPISTASYERDFSQMNAVCIATRTRLSVPHMSCLMFMSLTGPPLDRFEPLPYVKKWLVRHRRDANCTTCPERTQRSDNSECESFWSMLCYVIFPGV